MAKEKTTITVDPAKLEEARRISGVRTASATIDLALSLFIRRQRAIRDVKAYLAEPPADEENLLGDVVPDWHDLLDETDWDSEWPENP